MLSGGTGHAGSSHWESGQEGQRLGIRIPAAGGNSHSHIPQGSETTPPSPAPSWKLLPKLTSAWELAIRGQSTTEELTEAKSRCSNKSPILNKKFNSSFLTM